MDRLLHKIKKYIPKKLFKALQPAYHFILAWLAALWHRWPSEKLIVIGVTGTTGKTTSIYLMAKMLEAAGLKTGFTSTAMFNDGQNEWLNDKKMTMAGRFFTQKILAQMVKNKCRYAIVEVTSEGIMQFRHRFINFDILAYTCLYPEHIEAHGSFKNYQAAKGRLFAHLKKCSTKYAGDDKRIIRAESGFKKIALKRVKKILIVNADDKCHEYFLDFWAEEKWAYAQAIDLSASSGQDSIKTAEKIKHVFYKKIITSQDGISFSVDKTEIKLNLLGEFNATNAMNAVCLGLSQGMAIEKIKTGLESIKGLPGRLELINQGQPFTVIVDYAFEPKAVEKLYQVMEKIKHKKIIHVLGSTGGGRDAARRPKLGQLAGENSDYVIITNEDPYDDDPQTIIDQVAVGALAAGKILEKNLFKILDRRQAMAKALSLAGKNDIVLITGKGSEQAICIAGGEKIKWDDRNVVREEIMKLEFGSKSKK